MSAAGIPRFRIIQVLELALEEASADGQFHDQVELQIIGRGA